MSLKSILILSTTALLLVSCRTPAPTPLTEADAARHNDITLQEGDVVRVVFAGTPSLNTTQQIRRDGHINLPLVGDVRAAGLPPAQLEQQILDAYGTQLLSREVTVTLESAAIPIFVTGMVLRPGKVMSDRPITLLEAIMEAGGFDYSRANLKAIRVMRREGDRMRTFVLNLKPALEGQPDTPFYLRPADMVYVPERFTLF
jgi:polysaccharide export outer membrane protein